VRFQVGDIERYKRHLTVARGFSAASVSTYLTSVRRLCDYLVRTGLLKKNPAAEVEGTSRPRSHSRGALRPNEVERLLRCLSTKDELGLRDGAVIMLMLECGLSEIEIVRSNIEDLQATNRIYRLMVQGKGKTRKDACVTLSPMCGQMLERYLAVRGIQPPGGPLFASAGNRTRGARMSTRGVRDRVNFYLRLAGIRRGNDSNVTPYSLRHTTALLMASRGASADEIRERMRLGTIETAHQYLQEQWHIHSPR
jgi:site-specific recombinase XerC